MKYKSKLRYLYLLLAIAQLFIVQFAHRYPPNDPIRLYFQIEETLVGILLCIIFCYESRKIRKHYLNSGRKSQKYELIHKVLLPVIVFVSLVYFLYSLYQLIGKVV